MKHNLPTLSILHYVYGAFVCLSGFVAFVLIFSGLFIGSDFVAESSEMIWYFGSSEPFYKQAAG